MPDIAKICSVSGKPFLISELEQELCRKQFLPLPHTSPRERMRHLTAFSNLSTLFHGTCAATGEKILQLHRPEAPYPVYSPPYWWSDEWDPLSYGRDYDFSKTFFTQFLSLEKVVPQISLSVNYTTLENCDYISGASYCKNCYLVFNANNSEDCSFCYTLIRSRDCVDCTGVFNCELCYDSTFVENCYDLRHSFNCKNSSDSAFLWNCIGYKNCFGCVNLRQKEYCFYNEQLSKAAYQEKMLAVHWDSYKATSELKKRFMEHVLSFPQPAIRGIELENASGDFISHCQNVANCFEGIELEDCVNCVKVSKAKDCLDQYTWGEGTELVARTSRSGYDCHSIKCSSLCFLNSSNIEYSMWCTSSSNCFGCIGLRNQQYCILNKQHTKDEYLALRRRIINQMNDLSLNHGRAMYGEFFPYELSPFPFNDSDAMLYYPLDRKEAAKRNVRWAEQNSQEIQATAHWQNIPDRTVAVDSEITSQVLACSQTGEAYRIANWELELYRRRSLPLPRLHWQTRMKLRQEMMNPHRLYKRRCDRSDAPIQTTFEPKSGWEVWENNVYTHEFGC